MKMAIQRALFGLFFLFAGMVFGQPLEKTGIRIGVIPPEPLSFCNDQGEARGLHIDLLDEIVKQRDKWTLGRVAVNRTEGFGRWFSQGAHEKRTMPLWLWVVLGGIGAAAVFLFGLNRILRYEIRRATDALRKSETVLRRAQEIARVGSWELEVDQNQLVWSDETYRIFGVDPQTFRPSYDAFLELVHPDDRARLDAAYTASVREGRDSYESEHRIVRKSEVRYVVEKCVHERNPEGKIVRSFGMVHDVTEQKLAELALKRQNEELFCFNRIATGRELRMIQLKEEVNALCRLRGEPERYPLEFINQANQRPS